MWFTDMGIRALSISLSQRPTYIVHHLTHEIDRGDQSITTACYAQISYISEKLRELPRVLATSLK